MKRYLLFCGNVYYPAGGWEDFAGAFDTIDEAKAALPILKTTGDGFDWHDIVDTETMMVVKDV